MRIFNSRFPIYEKRTLAFAGVLLFIDQTTKFFFAGSALGYCNPAGPWGVGVGNEVMIPMMVVILVLLWYFLLGKETCEKWEMRSFIMVLSGGLSNLIDRIFFGCVRDFSLVSWFPAFNLADTFLTIGGAMLVLALLRKKTKGKRNENDESFYP